MTNQTPTGQASRRVLIASESKELVSEFKKDLEPEGISVFPYSNLNNLMKLLEVDPNFSIFVFDYRSNQDKVADLIEQLHDEVRFYNIPIILLLSENNIVDQFSIPEIGADDYLVVPYNKIILQLRFRILFGLLEVRQELADKEQKLNALKTFEQITVTLSHYLNNALTPLKIQYDRIMDGDSRKVKDFVLLTGRTVEFIKNVLLAMQEFTESEIIVSQEGVYKGLLLDIENKLNELKKQANNLDKKI